jgi:hypothetical protein
MSSHTPVVTHPLVAFLTLRRILMLDGITCVLMGILLVSAADPLARVLGLPSMLLLCAGIALFPSALLMFAAAVRSSRTMVKLIIALNVAWVIDSLLVVSVFFTASGFGVAFVLVQAAAVAVIAGLEAYGLGQQRSGGFALAR